MSNTPDGVYDLQEQESDKARCLELERIERQIAIDDLKWLMHDKRGRRIAFRLLEQAGVWRLSFDTDAMVMAFNEGRRNDGLRLLAQITEHCPERYTEMLKEHK